MLPARPALAVASLALLACAGTRSSVYATTPGRPAYTGVVRVVVTTVPPNAQELGIVEVESREELADLVGEFQRRVGELGGDVGLVDRYSTSFHIETSTSTQSYSCGTQQAPATCTRQVTQQHEVATMHLVGRALTTRGTAP
jgi:hypothetical protein